MKPSKINNNGQARLFSSPYLEQFTKSHPVAIYCIYLPVIGYFLYYSIQHYGYGFKTTAFNFFMGVKFWTIFEYVVHRYVFHWISKNPVIEKLTYIMHGNHHHYPGDRKRLFMPPLPSLLISSSIFGLMYAVTGNYAFMFFPGFILGHLLHSSLHYAIHAWPPPFKWMKPLWRNHYLHHYTNEAKGFGITSTFWDHVFGTMFDLKKHKEDKAKINALMFEKTTETSPAIASATNYEQHLT